MLNKQANWERIKLGQDKFKLKEKRDGNEGFLDTNDNDDGSYGALIM